MKSNVTLILAATALSLGISQTIDLSKIRVFNDKGGTTLPVDGVTSNPPPTIYDQIQPATFEATGPFSTFILPGAINTLPIHIFRNGLRQRPAIDGITMSTTSAGVNLSFSTPFSSTDTLSVDYWKKIP